MIDVAFLPNSELLNRAENCIYAIGPAKRNLPVKIGISTFVLKRFCTLQSSSPVPLFIFAVMRCQGLYEKKIHAALAEDRVHGEWFNRTSRVLEVIQVLRKGDLRILVQWLAETSKAKQ